MPDLSLHELTHASRIKTEVGEHLSRLAPHVPMLLTYVAPVVLLLLVVLLAVLFRSTFSSSSSGRKRTTLPAFAFDVEGGSGDHSGKSALHPSIAHAAATADVTTLRDWVSDERCAIDAKLAATGATALHAGATSGHANVVRLLLDAGADALCVDNDLSTPLHIVATHGHGLCVKALLDAGADTQAKDAKGQTPLAIAETNRHMGTARMMRLHHESEGSTGGATVRRAR